MISGSAARRPIIVIFAMGREWVVVNVRVRSAREESSREGRRRGGMIGTVLEVGGGGRRDDRLDWWLIQFDRREGDASLV